jgi:16S rRNA (uracil1498-N3)-methyltransferase
MSNIRLFFSESLSINLSSKLNKIQSHYLTKVMRIKSGENFSLFNENGEWQVKINQISKGIVEFLVLKKLREKVQEVDLWLAFTPIKSNYFNFMIQKATELGVTKFLPIISERTVVRKINTERLKKIIIEASEQSNRLTIPKIEETETLESFLKKNQKLNIIFGDINTSNSKLDSKKFNNSPICILIGPEGDFSENERQKIKKFENIHSLKLNNNILRTETATISALSIINYILNL